MDVSWLTTDMNFNTPPLAQIAPFDATFASQTRKMPTQLQSVEASTTARVPSQPGPEKASVLSVILERHWALDWALKVVRQVGRSVSLHEVSYCLLL